MSGTWEQYAAATDGGTARSVFYFDGHQEDLYGSFYEGDGRLGLGVVFCPAWSLEAIKSYVPRDVAAGVAALGGCALLFHYPATGDSFGRFEAVDLEALRRSAVAAAAEARRRAPELRWALAGYTLGASVAVLAAAEAEVDALLLLEPALDPHAYAAELAEQARRGQLDRGGSAGFFYGQPLPRLGADDPSPIEALEGFRGDVLLVRSAEGAPATPLPAGSELRTVPGAYQRRRERAPALVESALDWVAGLEVGASSAPPPPVARAVAGTDGTVVEHPVLIPTDRGLFGAVVTEPRAPIRAQLAFFHGAGDPRAGVNAHWAHTLRDVAALGVQVMRVDWAATYESHTAEGPVLAGRKVSLDEIVEWFRARSEGRPLFLLGSCFGADAVAELAPSRDDIAALGLVVPQLAAPRRSLGRLLGRPRIPELTKSVAAALGEILDRVPVWILAGDGDGDYPAIVERHFRRRRIRPTVSVAPGVKLHSFHSAAAQHTVRKEIVAWVAETLGVETGERTMGLEPTTPGLGSQARAG